MRKMCVKAGLPEPQFEEQQGFRVVFKRDIYTIEYFQKSGFKERQIKALMNSMNIQKFLTNFLSKKKAITICQNKIKSA